MGLKRFVPVVLTAAALMFVSSEGMAAKQRQPVKVEIAPPPASFGTDADGLRSVAQAEIKKMEALPKDRTKRGVVISLALRTSQTTSVVYNVNATVRDARSGAVLAVIETGAHSDGPISQEMRKEMAFTLVRDAVRRVPKALRTKA